jgi:hypothetical protein
MPNPLYCYASYGSLCLLQGVSPNSVALIVCLTPKHMEFLANHNIGWEGHYGDRRCWGTLWLLYHVGMSQGSLIFND